MRWWFMLFGILMVSGCSEDVIMLNSNIVNSPNCSVNVFHSFELFSFCDSTSFVNSSSYDSLSCASGNMTDVQYRNGSWSAMCCVFKPSKCNAFSVSNITSYTGLNLSAEHILSSQFSQGFEVTCCNAQGSMCYAPIMENFTGCGAGYSEFVSHTSFNNVSNNWSVVSCLNGFN